MAIDTYLGGEAQFYSPELAPTQLLVLGRGMEADGTIGRLTLERAQAAAEYCLQNGSIDTVVLSGDGTNGGDLSMTEAVAMGHAVDFPYGVDVRFDPYSRTTTENFLNGAELLEPDAVTGVVSHKAHLPRAMWLGQRVLGRGAALVGIAAEEYGASPEADKSVMIERANLAVSRMLYVGARGAEAMAAREQRIGSAKGVVRSVLRRGPSAVAQY